MMKVLVITTVRFRLNGITSVIMNYYRNMDRQGMIIDFVVPNQISDKYHKELEHNGSTVFELSRKSNPFQYQKELQNLLQKQHYDVVHIHGNSAMMLIDTLPCKRAGVKKIIVHSHNTTCSHMFLHKLLLPWFRKTYTDALACGNDAGKWLYGNEPFTVLRNGICLEQYAFNLEIREKYRQKIGAGEKIVIGHVGNFIEQKNHSFLIDVFAELLSKNSNYQLLLISDGALLEQMKQKVKSLHIEDSVIFLGKTTEVNHYLQAMDIFVLPSLYEGLPVVLIEAQAAGLPCLVSDCVTEEANLTEELQFIAIDDTKKWANAILHIKQSTAERSQNCKLWQKRIADKHYDIKSNTRLLRKIYEQADRK